MGEGEGEYFNQNRDYKIKKLILDIFQFNKFLVTNFNNQL